MVRCEANQAGSTDQLAGMGRCAGDISHQGAGSADKMEMMKSDDELTLMTMKYQVTDILTYALKRTRLKPLQMSPTAGVEDLIKKASWPVIPILEIWN